jgi:hypothetical protein
MGSNSSSSSFCKNKQNKILLAKRETTHLKNFLEKEKRRDNPFGKFPGKREETTPFGKISWKKGRPICCLVKWNLGKVKL